MSQPPIPKRVIDLLPTPFAWIAIPGSIGKTWRNAPYHIAKYPVTNVQFALFVEAGGYHERQWWTAAGWAERKDNRWAAPRNWDESDWNGAEQPVVQVSWYEAVAFCVWLSGQTGEQITLPSEAQWQYAAQGDDGRLYPWGKKWDGKRCNNFVNRTGVGKTTPVRGYEGKGDSVFGVTDMVGNVWEWCRTDSEGTTEDIHADAEYRVLRGGSWGGYNIPLMNATHRYWNTPDDYDDDVGFRIVRI